MQFSPACSARRTAYAFYQTDARSGRELTHSRASRLRSDRGIVLLEVLVAVVILATAGIALTELVGADLRAERDARSREATLASEERLLAAHTLLTRTELDQRLGRRAIGEFLIDIQRPEPALYRIAVLQQGARNVEDLGTVAPPREPAP